MRPRIFQMAYRQTSIDLDAIRRQNDQMFPPRKVKPEPNILASERYLTFDEKEQLREKAKTLMPPKHRFKTLSQAACEWIISPVTVTGDPPAKAYRVSQPLGGSRELLKVEIDVPDDPQHWVDTHGGSMEIHNADGKVIGKYSPSEASNLNFI